MVVTDLADQRMLKSLSAYGKVQKQADSCRITIKVGELSGVKCIYGMKLVPPDLLLKFRLFGNCLFIIPSDTGCISWKVDSGKKFESETEPSRVMKEHAEAGGWSTSLSVTYWRPQSPLPTSLENSGRV